MAKKNNVYLPSGQGGLMGGFTSSHKTRFEFSPQVVIYFALLVVVFIFILFNT